MMRLLHASWRYLSPSSLAKPTHRSLMIFVLPLPCGTEQSFSKYSSTFSGFSPFNAAMLPSSFSVCTQPMRFAWAVW